MAGNHGNCCFITIFENALEYVLFRRVNFPFCLYLEWTIFLDLIDQYTMIATQSTTAQSDDGRLDTSGTPCFWRLKLSLLQILFPRANKQTS